MEDNLERVCGNCQAAHPSEPFQSDFAVCLNAPELKPYLNDILERQDFSRCRRLVERIRFPWDKDACDDFNPIEDAGEELSPELAEKVMELAEEGAPTAGALRDAILIHTLERTDWSHAPADRYVRALRASSTLEAQAEAVRPFGFLIAQGNRAAFDALAGYLRALPAAVTVDDKALRIAILRELKNTREHQGELAHLLVEDLLRTPSNNSTRGWYSEVFRFFEESCHPEIAEEALGPVVNTPHFSARIRSRVQALLDSAALEGRRR